MRYFHASIRTLLALITMLTLMTYVSASDTPTPFVYGDTLPDAPELAARGEYSVGVRTVDVVNPDQIDIVNYSDTNTEPRYDRPLTLEIWYPAVIPDGTEELTTYSDVLSSGDAPARDFTFPGRALRDAEVDNTDGPYPLVIVSHGHLGSRVLMTYLTENLASKGYVVVAIDHTDSIHGEEANFNSTLLNRSQDQLFVLDEITRMTNDSSDFLSGVVDTDTTAIVGYSMGGYGALNAAGAGYSSFLTSFVPGGHAGVLEAGNAEYEAMLDERLKAIVAFAPWGGTFGLWTPEGLAGIEIPSLFVVGDSDDVSGYDPGVKQLFEGSVNSDRYMLVYQDALHNVAPNPPSPEAEENFDHFMHYAEPAWDTRRLNNINQHFVTAFLDWHLKNKSTSEYFELVENASDGVWSQDEDGNFTDEHTYWKGFQNRTALGLEMYHLSPQ